MDITNITNFVVRTDTIGAYINAISKIPPLTAQEERDLFAKYESYVEEEQRCKDILATFKVDDRISEYRDKLKNAQEQQIEIRNEIIARNLRFNFAVAKRYSTDDNLPDLINQGTMGMFDAFKKFDWRTENRFCSFAVWHIRRAINGYLNREYMAIRPKGSVRVVPKVKRIENDFFLKNGRKPSSAEVMEILEKDFGITVSSESELYGSRVDKFDDHLGDDEDLTLEKSPAFNERTAISNAYDDEIETESIKHGISESLKVLTDRERDIICMAYGYGYTRSYKDKEIGQALGLSSERVRQIRHAAIKKMRSAYVAAVEE